VAERVPILVGITGKRDLKGQDETVGQRLREAFDQVDAASPITPKVLLSGMAVGADTIAAELAIARPNWLVAAVLPLDRETYLEDFQGEAHQALETLLANPKVKTYALPPLRNPYTGHPCTHDELRNSANATNPLRVLHYEQLGLWLARAATLLIAVLPEGEEPDQAGGTARVVQYRLSGRPDAVALQVMSASAAVSAPLSLDIVALGPAWLIDAPNETVAVPEHPFTIRLGDAGDRDPVPPRVFERRLRRSLILARSFDGLARLGDTATPLSWQHERGADPAARLTAIHAQIDRIQGRHKRRLVSSSYALALLFWLAVGTYGLIEVARTTDAGLSATGLAIYLALVACAVVLHAAIDRRRWQRVTEDYRSVIEALRVQRAWWFAGLVGPLDQVDRYYLAGTQQPFGYLRQAVRNIVFWARLSGAPITIKEDWREVYDRGNRHSWVQEQFTYFRQRAGDRKSSVARSQMLSWELFFAAQFLAAWLFVDTVTEHLLPRSIEQVIWGPGWARAAIFLAAAGAFWVLRHLGTRTAAPRRRWSAAFAVLLALLIGPGLHFLGSTLKPQVPDAGPLAIAVAVVIFSAAAVAVRFVAEKLVWEAEAHRYEAALALFERAAGELDHIAHSGDPRAERTSRSRTVVRALGRAALEENEYWLRAHRERPVEQAVG